MRSSNAHMLMLIFTQDVALSPQELLGLKAIVLYLHQLPIQRKNVPALIYDPVALLRSIKQIVEKHRYDSPSKAVTGRPILIWPGEKAEVRDQQFTEFILEMLLQLFLF